MYYFVYRDLFFNLICVNGFYDILLFIVLVIFNIFCYIYLCIMYFEVVRKLVNIFVSV